MKTSESRILTSHVGSLPRSTEVVDLLDSREHGRPYDPVALDRAVRALVATLVQRQVTLGIDIVSDGEAGKISYATYVRDRLTGFAAAPRAGTTQPHLDLAPFPDFRRRIELMTGPRRFLRVACVGPVAAKSHVDVEKDLANMRAAVAAAPPAAESFLNAASPGVVASFLPNEYYPSHEAYLAAIAEAMHDEYAAIVGAGFLLQVDCPDLAMSRHTAFQDLSEAQFLGRARLHTEALNHALRGCPPDRVRIHVCWGNYEGPHTHDIDLAKILDIVLGIRAQAIVLEAANPRHEHEWAIWREIALPDDKILMPGVVDSSTNYVEHPDLVAQRLLRFAEAVGRERVIAGADCGFGTSAGHGKVDPEIAFLKLGSLVEGAARASHKLWPSSD